MPHYHSPNSNSSSPRRREVPLPVSLTLYNLYVPKEEEKDSNTTKLFRPEYTAQLLVPAVRLDVVFSAHSNHEEEEDILLYSSVNTQHSIHPTWNHLDECIEALNDESDSIYTNMRCNIVGCPSSNNTTQQQEIIVTRVSLHPFHLRRLPEEISHDNSSNNNVSWERHPPPPQLPPNAVIITFSDGSTRVCPFLYHLLVEQGVIVENNNSRDVSFLQDEEEEYRRQLRFDDDVFDTLDQTNWYQETPQSNQPLSLLETDDESKAVVVKSLGTDVDGISQEFASSLLVSENDSRSVDDDMGSGTRQHDAKSVLPIEMNVIISDLKREKEELEMLVAQEEASLEEELAALREVSTVANSQSTYACKGLS